MESVGADDVRDMINVSSAEVPDTKVLKMIKRAKGIPALLDFLGLFSGYRQTSGNAIFRSLKNRKRWELRTVQLLVNPID